MTKEKIEAMIEKARASNRCFLVIPGRYYAAMWFATLPLTPGEFSGSDVNALLWREENEPTTWVLQWRFRYYRDELRFGSCDERNWFLAKVRDESEDTAMMKARLMFFELARMAGSRLEELEIHGNAEEFWKVVKRVKPDWLEVGMDDETAGKGGDPKGN